MARLEFVFSSCPVWLDEATLNEASYPLVEEEVVEKLILLSSGCYGGGAE